MKSDCKSAYLTFADEKNISSKNYLKKTQRLSLKYTKRIVLRWIFERLFILRA